MYHYVYKKYDMLTYKKFTATLNKRKELTNFQKRETFQIVKMHVSLL